MRNKDVLIFKEIAGHPYPRRGRFFPFYKGTQNQIPLCPFGTSPLFQVRLLLPTLTCPLGHETLVPASGSLDQYRQNRFEE